MHECGLHKKLKSEGHCPTAAVDVMAVIVVATSVTRQYRIRRAKLVTSKSKEETAQTKAQGPLRQTNTGAREKINMRTPCAKDLCRNNKRTTGAEDTQNQHYQRVHTVVDSSWSATLSVSGLPSRSCARDQRAALCLTRKSILGFVKCRGSTLQALPASLSEHLPTGCHFSNLAFVQLTAPGEPARPARLEGPSLVKSRSCLKSWGPISPRNSPTSSMHCHCGASTVFRTAWVSHSIMGAGSIRVRPCDCHLSHHEINLKVLLTLSSKSIYTTGFCDEQERRKVIQKRRNTPRLCPTTSANPGRPVRMHHDPHHYLAHSRFLGLRASPQCSSCAAPQGLPTVSPFLLKLACGISTVLQKFCTFGSCKTLIFTALRTVSIAWIHKNFSTCHLGPPRRSISQSTWLPRATPLRQYGHSARQQPPPRRQPSLASVDAANASVAMFCLHSKPLPKVPSLCQ